MSENCDIPQLADDYSFHQGLWSPESQGRTPRQISNEKGVLFDTILFAERVYSPS
jgi:hypothetical protein